METPALHPTRCHERRRHPRIHVLLPASLVSGDRVVPGLLLDLSASGARLQLSDSVDPDLPATLRLARQVHFQVSITWRQANVLGLRFDEAPGRVAGTLAAVLPDDSLAA